MLHGIGPFQISPYFGKFTGPRRYRSVFPCLPCCVPIGILVWGYLSAGPELSFYRLKFTPVYLWSVFAINIVITGIAGKYRRYSPSVINWLIKCP